MEIERIFCPCEDRTFPPDHYESGACKRPPMPPEWIAAMLESRRSDERHAGGAITATRLLTCPLQPILLDNFPVTLDVRRLTSPFGGTVKHNVMAAHPRPGWLYSFPVQGPLFGAFVSGEIDAVKDDFSEIVDWKSHAESSHAFKHRRFQAGQTDMETAAQVNIYRLLLARYVLGVPDDSYRPRLSVWHLADVRAGKGPGEPEEGEFYPSGKKRWKQEPPPPPAFEVELPVLTEEQILRLHPNDDERNPGTQPQSVRQIVGFYKQFEEDRENGLSAEMAGKRVPLVGRNMWRGTMCTRYCLAREVCDRLNGIMR